MAGNEIQASIIAKITGYFEEADIKVEKNNNNGVDMLRLFPDDIGENNGSVLLELCFIPVEDDDVTESFFQIYSTIAKDIETSAFPKLNAMLNEMNLTALAGCYGIYTEQRQLYHRYVCISAATEEEALYNDIITAINWSLNVIDGDYDALMSALD